MEECTDDLNRACESMESMKGDPRYFLSEIADDHNFVETKKGYAKDMVTGWMCIRDRMCTKPQMYDYLIKVAKQPKHYALTDVLLETLSIIAYKQPITRAEIEKIRGVSCSHAVSRLVDYNLVCELGRLDEMCIRDRK